MFTSGLCICEGGFLIPLMNSLNVINTSLVFDKKKNDVVKS